MDKPKLTIGSKVFLRHRPPYLKTADPMPMLRPADILEVGDQGVIIDIRPGGYLLLLNNNLIILIMKFLLFCY